MAVKEQINTKGISEGALCTKLFNIVKHTKQVEVELECDVCKKNPVVVLCTSCIQCLCKVCHEHHRGTGEENNEHDIIPLDKTSFCLEHNKSFEFYCEKCDKFACSKCKVKHSSGDNHNLGIIEQMASKHRNILTDVAAPIDEISKALSETETKLIRAQKRLEEQFTEIDQSIDNQYEIQLKNMKERHDHLKKELTDIESQKKKVLVVHLEEIKLIQNEVFKVKKLLEDVKKTSDEKVFSTKKEIVELYVQKINGRFRNLSSETLELDKIAFDVVPESVEVLGQFILTPREVRDHNNSSYAVSTKAEEVKEAKLSACTDRLEIKRSPFSIESQDVHAKIINCDGRMGNPWGIAIAKNGMWAVTDVNNHCVYIFNSQNQLVYEFGRKGSGKGKFNQPFGLAFDSDYYLYVVDGGNHRVQKFDTNGKYLLEFGTKGNGNGQLEGPFGTTTHFDKVYVADFTNKRISVFQTAGRFYLSFGSDHLCGPRDVAINSNDQLLVADDYHRIYTFTLNGDFVSRFGKYGNCEGELNRPLSVATTWNKKILISDQNHCVSIFSEDGQFVCCLGSSHGASKGQLNYPYGVACISNSIYVTDLINQRVQIFNLSI